MKTRLSAILLSGFFALSLVACDDILLPDDPLDPGNGGGQDTTVNVDTLGDHSQLVITGTFIPRDAQKPILPDGSRLTIAWAREDGQSICYGEGQILNNNEWRIVVKGALPADAYYGSPYGRYDHAIGEVVLIRPETPIGVPVQISPYGGSAEFRVVYDSNRPTIGTWGPEFLHLFPKGYMLGEMVDNGTLMYPPLVPVQTSDVKIHFYTW